MRKIVIGFAIFAVLAVAAYLRFRHSKAPLETAYAGNREVILWTTTAQVRERVATVSFGDRLAVLDRFQDEVEVRTEKGAVGWVSEGDLLSSELWGKARDLDKKAEAMPVEARGHTRVLGNLHVEPGRDTPRIRQLNRNAPLDLLIREPVDVPPANPGGAAEETQARSGAATPATKVPGKKEDWWLVLARTPDQGAVAGWLLGRFIELDVPAPLPDYASAAGMRIVGWFELNKVKDADGTTKPQYLVVGAKGPQGQVCDFSLLRVYTWSAKHGRYETAFVDSSACGKLPVEFTRAGESAADMTFSFQDLSDGPPQKRTYRMVQTMVRRARPGQPTKPHKHAGR